MSYNNLWRRRLPFIGFGLFVVAVVAVLVGCGGGDVETESPTGLVAQPTQDLSAPLQVEVVTPPPTATPTAQPSPTPPMGKISVEIVGEGFVSTDIGFNHTAIHFRDVLLTRPDGTMLRCMVTIIEAIELGMADSVTQTCEPFAGRG